jgi:hypothetical protein
MEDYELPIPAEELARLTLGENCDQETFDDFVIALGGDDY